MNSKILREYVLPVLMVFGAVLNLLSFLIMRRMRNFSITSKYMSLLGLVDLSVLLVGAGANLLANHFSFSPDLMSVCLCKLVSFSFYFLADLSVFIIVIMTVERFYAVFRPVQASKMRKKRNFKINTFVSMLLAGLINCHFLIFYTVRSEEEIVASRGASSHNQTETVLPPTLVMNETVTIDKAQHFYCNPWTWQTFYDRFWIYIDASIYSFIPSILLICFNVLIIRCLAKAYTEGSKLIEERKGYHHNINNSFYSYRSNILVPNTHHNTDKRNSLRENNSIDEKVSTRVGGRTWGSVFSNYTSRYSTRITLMLIVLNISFCVFSMPIVILQIIASNRERSAAESTTSSSTIDSSSLHISNETDPSTTQSQHQINSDLDLIKAVAELLQYLNHSTNFFFYSFSGKTFRNETKSFLKQILRSLLYRRDLRKKHQQHRSHQSQFSYSGGSINNEICKFKQRRQSISLRNKEARKFSLGSINL